MANQEQLEILKQGVEAWNEWRERNANIVIDLRGADLHTAKLSGAQLKGADLREAELGGADLHRAELSEANLSGAHLDDADLRGANLGRARLDRATLLEATLSRANLKGASLGHAAISGAHLTKADVSGADLRFARLGGVDLRGADLSGAVIVATQFNGGDLKGCNFLGARVGDTLFRRLDLSRALALEGMVHGAPSTISTDTLVLSKGKIPETFLLGCGLSDWEIEETKLYEPQLSNEDINKILYKIYDLRAKQAIQISPLFVSYSHADSKFVDKIGDQLTEKGVRYWRDIHDATSGRLEKQIDRAMRLNPTVLLILSKRAVKSDWVEHEVREARALEKEMGRDVLCPVALDDSWKSSRWPKRVMEQVKEYNILDFSEWEDESKFGRTFGKLIDGLGLYYKG